MSDYNNVYHTKSSYTKTGKKVKCISSGRTDLIYKKVYDVFVDNGGCEFVIDESCDRLYDSMEFPLWIEVFGGMVDKANETKPKSKAGKKVKSIHDGCADLTYNKVYDVFIDNKGDEFIIDDVGDKRYWSISGDDYYELVDDVASATNTTNETKPKFKVGDKVKVVNTYYTSQFVDVINVGDTGITGVIVSIDDNDNITPYLVKFEDSGVGDNWWFTDKCIELVNDDTGTVEYNPTEKTPIVSDGGSSSYYAQQIPKGMLERFNTTGTIEAKDVIRLFLGNDFNMGNIFKAYCRVISLRNGKGKAGIDEQYDLTKAKFFTEDELNYYLENKDV